MNEPNQITAPPIRYIDPPLTIDICAQLIIEDDEKIQQFFEPEDLRLMDAQIRECYFVMKKIKEHPFGYFFHLPLNPYGLKMHSYIDTIHRPIDLYTISYKLTHHLYKNPNKFSQDMILMFNNALFFNKDNREVVEQIRNIQKYFAQLFQELVANCEKMIMVNEYSGEQRTAVKRKINKRPKKLKIKLSRQQTMQIVRENFDQESLKILAKKLNSINQVRRRLIISVMNKKFGLSFKQNFILTALSEEQLIYLIFLAKDQQQQNYGCGEEQMREYQQGKRIRVTRYGFEEQESEFDLDDN